MLWDVAGRTPLGEPLKGHQDTVQGATFSPDGKTLASASADKTVMLWDVVSRTPLGEPLKGHQGEVWGVTFSPDGKTLASASADKAVMLWDLDVALWLRRACAIANRNLTHREWRNTWEKMFRIRRPVQSCRCPKTEEYGVLGRIDKLRENGRHHAPITQPRRSPDACATTARHVRR